MHCMPAVFCTAYQLLLIFHLFSKERSSDFCDGQILIGYFRIIGKNTDKADGVPFSDDGGRRLAYKFIWEI